MDFPPLSTTGSLNTTIEQLLPSPDGHPLLITGSSKLARHITLKGYTVHTSFTEGTRYATVVAMDSLPKKQELRWLLSTTSKMIPEGRLILIEQSDPLTGRRGVLVRLLSMFGFLHTPEQLNRLFLKCGFRQIRQQWPQGLRSIVVTSGYLDPLAPNLHEILALSQ